jgi:hypothetical protein
MTSAIDLNAAHRTAIHEPYRTIAAVRTSEPVQIVILAQHICLLATLLLSTLIRSRCRHRLWLAPDPCASQQLLDQRLQLRKLDCRQLGRAQDKNEIPARANSLVRKPNRLTDSPARTIAIDRFTNPLANHETAS